MHSVHEGGVGGGRRKGKRIPLYVDTEMWAMQIAANKGLVGSRRRPIHGVFDPHDRVTFWGQHRPDFHLKRKEHGAVCVCHAKEKIVIRV